MIVGRWLFELLVMVAGTPAILGGWLLVRKRSSRVERWLGLMPLGAGVAFAAMFSSLGHPLVIATEVDHVVQFAHRIDVGAIDTGTTIDNRTDRELVVFESLDEHTYREIMHVPARSSDACPCAIDGEHIWIGTVRGR